MQALSNGNKGQEHGLSEVKGNLLYLEISRLSSTLLGTGSRAAAVGWGHVLNLEISKRWHEDETNTR